MLKILIVDDDIKKVGKIIEQLRSVNFINPDDIDYVNDSVSAKKKLRVYNFDLLILDVALPNRIEEEALVDGGARLLNEIYDRPGYNIPLNIIGITSFDDAFIGALSSFHERLHHILKYSETETDWEQILTSRVNHIIASKKNLTTVKSFESLMCVLCALEQPELTALLSLDWSWNQTNIPFDDSIYYTGEITKDGNQHTIISAAASRMGMPATSALAMKMITTFLPKYIAMTGITAGIKGKTQHGDIVVADPAWDWGSGKWVSSDGSHTFLQAPHQLSLSTSLRSKFKLFSRDKAVMSQIKSDWMGEAPSFELNLHVGPLASGASVLADGKTIEEIQKQHRQTLGVEMETYGLYVAAEEAPLPKPQFFSIKSVVDFGDGEKDDKYHKYAAFTSARALKYFTELYLLND
jgi:nucleoside phosphorylase/CheY-like chemotaxis protein